MTTEYFSGLTRNENDVREYNALRESLGVSDIVLFEKSYWNLYTFHEKFANEHVRQSELLGETEKERMYAAMVDYYDGFEPDFGKYRFDYVLVGEYERRVSSFDLPANLRLLWSNGKFDIYGL